MLKSFADFLMTVLLNNMCLLINKKMHDGIFRSMQFID